MNVSLSFSYSFLAFIDCYDFCPLFSPCSSERSLELSRCNSDRFSSLDPPASPSLPLSAASPLRKLTFDVNVVSESKNNTKKYVEINSEIRQIN